MYYGSYRVIRGGTWSLGASYCTSSNRYGYRNPSIRSDIYGFRVVLAPVQ